MGEHPSSVSKSNVKPYDSEIKPFFEFFLRAKKGVFLGFLGFFAIGLSFLFRIEAKIFDDGLGFDGWFYGVVDAGLKTSGQQQFAANF